MGLMLRCCAAALLGIASIVPASRATTADTSATITETLSLTFLTPSLGWRAADRWNPSSGGSGSLSVDETTDGGMHWHPRATVGGAVKGEGGSFDVHVSHILFADRRDGWLYGQRLYATHDGGRSWRRVPLRGSRTELFLAGRSVWRLDSTCDAAMNLCRLTSLISTAGSDAWQEMSWRPPPAAAIVPRLARADRLHAWLVSGQTMMKGHMVLNLLGTTDGGRSWHALPMPCIRSGAGAMEAQVVPHTAASLWLFCASEPSAGAQPKSVFRSSDGGRTWRMVADSGGLGGDNSGLRNLTVAGYLNDAAVTTQTDAWLALSRGTLWHTADGGHSWHAAFPIGVANPGGGGVGPVQFVDAYHGWLFSFPDLLFRTVDGGRHWQRVPV
jgi:photosystem II stability/assembly factor-like uncharacterized protein